MAKRKGVSIPKIKQLPSGAYNCYLRIKDANGITQNISITDEDYKVVEAKAVAIKSGIVQAEKNAKQSHTLKQAIENYIDVRRSICSPSTIRGYATIGRTRFQKYMHRRCADFTPELCKRMVSEEARLCSPKTLKNAWRFIASVLYEETGKRFEPPLPQEVRNELPYLTPEQLPAFLEALKGDLIEVAALLGLCSLRRSEILGLTWDNVDLAAESIKVSGAVVFDENGDLVEKKTNKNATSQRTVPILIPRLLELLKAEPNKNGRVVTVAPTTIRRHLENACAAAGLPVINTHGLRHTFASVAYMLNMPERVVMQIGGWSNTSTMHKIYIRLSEHYISNEAQRLKEFFTVSNKAPCPVCGEQTETVFRNKSGNIVGCLHCLTACKNPQIAYANVDEIPKA